MPITSNLYAFIGVNIKRAPEEAGVYALYQNGTPIYIGRAQGGKVTIRSRLKDHMEGREGRCTQAATHYKREVTPNGAHREKELIAEYYNENRRLPRCNSGSL